MDSLNVSAFPQETLVETMKGKEERIYVFGKIEYLDAFRAKRNTYFCDYVYAIFIMQDGERVLRWITSPHSSCNDAD